MTAPSSPLIMTNSTRQINTNTSHGAAQAEGANETQLCCGVLARTSWRSKHIEFLGLTCEIRGGADARHELGSSLAFSRAGFVGGIARANLSSDFAKEEAMKAMKKVYVVSWKNTKTGRSGMSEPLTREKATQLAHKLNNSGLGFEARTIKLTP
jgi:hypothetical protein